MTDVGRHPRIKLYTLSEVVDVKGYVGNFDVKILKKARYVDEKECTACGECSKVCPVVRPDEFNLGLSSRKAIYSPFPQAVPSAYVLNANECLGHNPAVCAKCVEVCESGCINFHMSDEEIVERVGTIVVATGLGTLRPHGHGRIRLHPLRKRADQPGIRTPGQRRRSQQRGSDPAVRSQTPPLHRFYPVRRFALGPQRAMPTVPTCAA